jgi:hypothetical protein
MESEGQDTPEPQCKNCQHAISLHKPNCLSKENRNENNVVCGCDDAQYYNAIISGDYVGWVEIHCNSCGTIIGFLDSTIENIFDYTTLCPKCIEKTFHQK